MLPDFRKQLQRCVHKGHTDCKDKPIVFLKRKCDELKRSETDLTLVIESGNLNMCETLHKVDCPNAHCGEGHGTPKIPSYLAQKIVFYVFANSDLKVIIKFPLSISGVSRRIEHTNCNIECELDKTIKNSQDFTMQVDKSTDIDGLYNLLVFVRYTYIYGN
jgi:hypothetical protein